MPQLVIATPFQFVMESPNPVPESSSRIPLTVPLLMLVTFVGHAGEVVPHKHASPLVPMVNRTQGLVPDWITNPDDAAVLFSSSCSVDPVARVTAIAFAQSLAAPFSNPWPRIVSVPLLTRVAPCVPSPRVIEIVLIFPTWQVLPASQVSVNLLFVIVSPKPGVPGGLNVLAVCQFPLFATVYDAAPSSGVNAKMRIIVFIVPSSSQE